MDGRDFMIILVRDHVTQLNMINNVWELTDYNLSKDDVKYIPRDMLTELRLNIYPLLSSHGPAHLPPLLYNHRYM